VLCPGAHPTSLRSRSERLPSLILFGLFLVAWGLLCFWAGPNFVLVAVILLLAAVVPVALVAGHRFLRRDFIYAEVALLPLTLIAMFVSGFNTAAVIAFGVALGVDTLTCSYLLLRKGRGALRNATRNLLIILAVLGIATGAAAVVSLVAPVPSCGSATVGVGGLTDAGSAAAGQCFVTAAENCVAKSLSVQDSSIDERATHAFRVVEDADAECHFTDTVTYGPTSGANKYSATYTCPALTDQVGQPGEQQVQLTQCAESVVPGVAAPIIPTNAYQPLATPSPG
jgi:hypothetical protein